MNKSSSWTALRTPAFRQLSIATVISGTRVARAIRRKIVKNEYQEDGVSRDPLILVAPAANLVAILRLNWLDDIDRAAASAITAVGTIWSTRCKFRIRERAVYTAGRIDHDPVTPWGNR
jgi:hypothetical protein